MTLDKIEELIKWDEWNIKMLNMHPRYPKVVEDAKQEITNIRASVDVEKLREALNIEVEHYTDPKTAAFQEKYKQMPSKAKTEAAATLLKILED